jgi:hypothetical protein
MKNLLALIGIVFYSTTLFSQDVESNSSKSLEYGLSIGVSYNDYRLSPTPQIESSDNVYGMNVGVLTKINFSEKISIIPQASINFRDSSILFTDDDGNELENTSLNIATLDFPLHLSMHLLPQTSLNPGLVFGPRYRYNISDTEDQIILYDKSQFSIDVGFSFDFKFSEFTMRSCFSYSRGTNNLLTDAISRNSDIDLKMHSYGITIQFFG